MTPGTASTAAPGVALRAQHWCERRGPASVAAVTRRSGPSTVHGNAHGRTDHRRSAVTASPPPAAAQVLVNPDPVELKSASAEMLYVACPDGPLAVLYDAGDGLNGRARPFAPPLATVAEMLEAGDAVAQRQMQAQWCELERWHAAQPARTPEPFLRHNAAAAAMDGAIRPPGLASGHAVPCSAATGSRSAITNELYVAAEYRELALNHSAEQLTQTLAHDKPVLHDSHRTATCICVSAQ